MEFPATEQEAEQATNQVNSSFQVWRKVMGKFNKLTLKSPMFWDEWYLPMGIYVETTLN